MFNEINDENFTMFAIKAYNKPNGIISEFEEDIRRIKYVKRLIKKYQTTGKIKERLLLNHIIILSNVFGVESTVRMLFFKLEESYYPILKTFLLFLGMMPNIIYGINGKTINSKDITVDIMIGNKLRNI